jgi:hypothetical protein
MIFFALAVLLGLATERPIQLAPVLPSDLDWICLPKTHTHAGDDGFAQDWTTRIVGRARGAPLSAPFAGIVALAGERGAYGVTLVILDPKVLALT